MDAKRTASHLEVFPEGQFVAVENETQKIVGMSASLIVLWEDYEIRGKLGRFYGQRNVHQSRRGKRAHALRRGSDGFARKYAAKESAKNYTKRGANW